MDTQPGRLSELPLWRLLVLLSDCERALGPTAPTTRTIAAEVQKRLNAEPPPRPALRKAVPA